MKVTLKNKNIICGVVIGYLLIGAINIAGIQLNLIISIAYSFYAILLIFTANQQGVRLELNRRCIINVIGILTCMIVAIAIDGFADISRWIFIVCCFLFMLGIYISVNSIYDIKSILICVVILSTISSIFLIGQSMGISIAISLGNFVNGAVELDIESLRQSSRYSGLSSSVISYAYHCAASIAILLTIKSKKMKALRYFALVINMVGLMLNRTRSAVIAVVICFVIILIQNYKKSNHKPLYIVAFTVFGILIVGFFALELGALDDSFLGTMIRIDEAGSSGTQSRIPMNMTAFNHAIHYPFGMGRYIVEPSLVIGTENARVFNIVVNTTAHNLFANCAAYYGIICFILLLTLYKNFYKEIKYNNLMIKKTYQEKTLADRENKAISLAIITLLINSLFHNSYILNGEIITWICIGLLMSLGKILRRMKD